MKNFVQNGKVVPYVVPSETTIESGDVVVIGALIGVATQGGTEGETISVDLHGVFELPKASGSITQGDLLYFNTTNKEVTKSTGTSYANKPIGIAFSGAESADETVNVLLDRGNGFDVTLGQLDQGGATDGQVIKWDNTAGTWEAGTDLDVS